MRALPPARVNGEEEEEEEEEKEEEEEGPGTGRRRRGSWHASRSHAAKSLVISRFEWVWLEFCNVV